MICTPHPFPLTNQQLIVNKSSAIVYPRCTNTSSSESESDCGSIGWAFTLFIAWNLLSMVSPETRTCAVFSNVKVKYIFVNMFTGECIPTFDIKSIHSL